MKYEELIILLPCHSLEDFPLHHEGDDAQSLLASWTALWHPALIASAGAMPTWHRVDDPPEELANRLIVVPSVSMSELQTGFAQRAKGDGACFIRNKQERDEIIETALESLDGGAGDADPELVADFLALGYCYLQVELLTRQMRYSSNLDEVHFSNQVVGAANAEMQGNHNEAREKLSACFDVLAEERDHYYPVDSFLVDLTLVAPTTVGPSLRQELSASVPTNLLISGATLADIANSDAEMLDLLKHGVEENRISLLGGELREQRLPLLGMESILYEFRRGLAAYETNLGRCPTVYGRRRFGLTPALPQILHRLGIESALHATLDDGRFPEGMQIKTRWEGNDGTSIDALARAPIDATKPETYLNLAVKMGESMDMDHVATVCFAHWPGQTSPWYEDLRRIAAFCSALGKFVTVDEYFRETDDSGQLDRFTPDQYRSPYLKQAVIRRHPDPISTSVRYWRRRAAAEATQTLSTLSALVRNDCGQTLSPLLAEVDDAVEEPADESFDKRLDAAATAAAAKFADSLPRKQGDSTTGYLVANPCSFVRRIGVDVSELDELPEVAKPIYAAGESESKKHAVVDVPPMGFVWVSAAASAKAKKRKPPKPLADDRREKDGIFILHNEYFEAVVDPTTGALRSIHEFSARGNRISQQLGFRMPGERKSSGDHWHDPEDTADYSVMSADSVEIVTSTPALGEIVAKGKLTDRHGKRLADFQQRFQLWRGSRVLRLDIELEPHEQPRSDPWNSYYASRFAWADETVDVWSAVNQTRHAVTGKRIEAPHYIELTTEKARTAIFTGGLPFHRRQGLRMLDSLLIVRGETARRFQIGIGIDLTHPMHEAVSLLTPHTIAQQEAAPPSPADSSWLFHIDSKNVIATFWEPLVEEGSVAGFRARLLETSGRPARVGISSFRELAAARQVDFRGNELGDSKIDKGKLRLDLAGHEWVEVEAKFK